MWAVVAGLHGQVRTTIGTTACPYFYTIVLAHSIVFEAHVICACVSPCFSLSNLPVYSVYDLGPSHRLRKFQKLYFSLHSGSLVQLWATPLSLREPALLPGVEK
jgi:hypothetical protein